MAERQMKDFRVSLNTIEKENRCKHGMWSHRICEICEAEDQALERAALLAEGWDYPLLAADIRAMKVRDPIIETGASK